MTYSLSPSPSSVAPARVTFSAPGMRPLTLTPADIAELSRDGHAVEFFGMTYTRESAPAATPHGIYVAVDCSCSEHYDAAQGDPARLVSRALDDWQAAGEFARPWVQWANGHAGATVSAHDGEHWNILSA